MFFNKRGAQMAIAVIVTAIILLFVGYVLLHASTKGIKDATDEFDSLLNLNTADCDHDHDGFKDKEDVCPCDDDDFFDSRTHYVAGTNCQAKRRCKNPGGDIKRFSECSDWEYYINLNIRECNNWFTSEGRNKITSTYRNECGNPPIRNQEVPFSQTCADKILAKHKDSGAFTFTCKTSTRACKEILKKPC